MGSQPQSQDVEHQAPPVREDNRIRREHRRESAVPKQRTTVPVKRRGMKMAGERVATPSCWDNTTRAWSFTRPGR